MPDLVDTHCHLDFERFDADREAVVERALEASVTRIVAPGINLESSQKVVELAARFEGVFAAVGVHPNTNVAIGEGERDALRSLAQEPKVVAIGEIGLDYFREHTPHPWQQANLRAQLELASELGLPVILHNREATSDLLRMLGEWRANARDGLEARPGVLHTFSADWDAAQAALALGFYLGFSGPLTYDKSDETREVAAQAPADRILVETDAPFLVPQPLRGRHKRNEPAYVAHVAAKLAEVRGLQEGEAAALTTSNASRLFDLPA